MGIIRSVWWELPFVPHGSFAAVEYGTDLDRGGFNHSHHSFPLASLLRHRESFDEEALGPCGSLAERCYFLIGGRFEPVPSRLEGGKNHDSRSRRRAVHPLQRDDRCAERNQPAPKRRESGLKLFVVRLKSRWVVNLD